MKTGILFRIIPDKKIFGKRFYPLVLYPMDNLGKPKRSKRRNNDTIFRLGSIIVNIPAQRQSRITFEFLCMNHFKQFCQPRIEMMLPHPFKIPICVIPRLVFNLKPSVGLLLKFIDKLNRCFMKACSKQIGLTISGYGNIALCTFFLYFIVQEQVTQLAKAHCRR